MFQQVLPRAGCAPLSERPLSRARSDDDLAQRSAASDVGRTFDLSNCRTSLQAKLMVGASHDPLEREAELVADAVTQTTGRAVVHANAPARLSRSRSCVAERPDFEAPSTVHDAIGAPGQPLNASTRSYFEPRFDRDFSAVRIHTGPAAERSARELGAHAYTLANHIVFGAGRFAPAAPEGRHLLAHELTHVVQQGAGAAPTGQTIRRKVILRGAEVKDVKVRDAFIKAHKWKNATRARAVMEDMAAAGDAFDFASDGELEIEIDKRISTVQHMEESQTPVPMHGQAFAYPFSESNQTDLYGPRVNYAAREYWIPALSDDYADRNTKANKHKNEELARTPRSGRNTFYGDQPPGAYSWKLSEKGNIDPYRAITLLFTPQALPRRRSLIHCDYLISVVNMLSLADAIGPAKFKERVRGLGADQFVLQWNAFQDLHLTTNVRDAAGNQIDPKFGVKPGLASTQRMNPSSPRDLIIGDHVVFINHFAYDPLNQGVGNAWRLENAVLVARGAKDNPDRDEFLGHGSGRKTAVAMLATLAGEFHQVYDEAEALIKRSTSKDKATHETAMNRLAVRFPNIRLVGAEFRLGGMSWGRNIDEPFDKFKSVQGKDVIGLSMPWAPGHMNAVERPIESAR